MNRHCTYSLNRLYDNSTQLGELLQDNTYTYDNVGNIISIQDSGRNQRTQIYEYDNADRLIRSEGRMPHEFSTLGLYDYRSDYRYSPAGRLEYKFVHSKRYSTALGDYEVNYTNNYHYDEPNNPFAVTKIHGDESPDYGFKWDANGNLLYADGGKPYSDRRLCWTEDNRLQGFMETGDEGGIAAYYNYTADGERNIKLTSPRLDMQQNASQFNNPPLLIPTLYASPLITLTHKGYTNVTEVESKASELALPRCRNVTERKHYFEEGRRICSKIGGWFLWRVPADDILKPVEEVKDNYEEQHNQQRQGVHETFGKCIGAWPELIDKYDLLKMLLKYKEEEKNFYYHSDLCGSRAQSQARLGYAEMEQSVRSKHLGSAAYLTSRGDVTQTLNYLPYGEDWIDVQNNLDPRLGQYTFNGKEKDYESGFHYYGARYYWSEILTGWLSVDPMADKYPSISPYAYCAWNPVKLVDPDGMAYGDPPSSLKYTIKRGDCFWNLENEWNLPHGTLQEINPSSDPHNLQVGQVINAAKLDNDFIVVGNDAPIPNERELKTPNEEGPSGLITLTSSEDFLQFRMAFEAILPSLGGEFSGFMQKSGRSLTKILSRNTSWQYGHNHSMIKWNNEFKKRGWSENQVSKTIKNGKSTPATNKVNPGNKATRYMNKNTGKSVIIDKKSRELLHVGSKDFKYD